MSWAEIFAIERECSDQANAWSLYGSQRKAFRAECKKRLGLYPGFVPSPVSDYPTQKSSEKIIVGAHSTVQ
jgi:hypothetical protein